MNAILEFFQSIDFPSIMEYLRDINEASVALRMIFAVLCGGIIGIEREHKQRAAGFRTHTLICIGAALTMMTGQYLLSLKDLAPGNFVSDPGRLGAQVIAGIGFIGAGSIIVTKRRQVKGLTTAAGLWTSAVMGLAIGAGYYEAALITMVLVLLIEIFGSRIDWYMLSNSRELNLYVEFTSMEVATDIVAEIRKDDIHIVDVEFTRKTGDVERETMSAIFSLQFQKKKMHNEVMTRISEVEGVTSVEEL